MKTKIYSIVIMMFMAFSLMSMQKISKDDKDESDSHAKFWGTKEVKTTVCNEDCCSTTVTETYYVLFVPVSSTSTSTITCG